jgi:Holliday junction DNA helicase RuvA
MIAQLKGVVARAAASFVVLDVGGVGYKVNVPVTVIENLPAAGEPLILVTHTLVREDDISLFGFRDDAELRVFELLLSVTGVGPKAALALLSALPADELARTVANEEVRSLTRVPGIGAKTAQRLVLELKDKLAQLAFEHGLEKRAGTAPRAAPARKKDPAVAVVEDVVSALVNLGYNKPDAARATEGAVDERAKSGADFPEFAVLLRAALNR